MTDETALDDENTSEATFEFIDSVDTEWVNIGTIGYHEDGQFTLFAQPEANGVRLKEPTTPEERTWLK